MIRRWRACAWVFLALGMLWPGVVFAGQQETRPNTRSKAVSTVSVWNAPTQQATRAEQSAAGKER